MSNIYVNTISPQTGSTVSVTASLHVLGDDLSLTSDSAILSLGDGGDATLTHDGTTGLTIAATPISINSTGDLTLDSTTDIILDAAGNDVIFKDNGTNYIKFTNSSGDVEIRGGAADTDIIFTEMGDGNEIFRVDGGEEALLMASSKKLMLGATQEYLYGDGTDIHIGVGSAGDINIPADIGLTFGDDGEKIEGDGTNLSIASSAELDLTAGTTVDINATTTITMDAGGAGSIDFAAGASNITLTTDDAAQDFTISLAGATDSSLILSSTGTGADALQITTSAGGIDITNAGAAGGEDLDISSSAASVNISGAEAARDAVKISAGGSGGGIQLQVPDADGIAIMGNASADTYVSVAVNSSTGDELIKIINSAGNTDGTDDAGAIELSAPAGGIGLAWSDVKDLWAEGGRAIITANEDAADCILLHADDGGTSQTIRVLNDAGTNAAAIGLTATAGGITLTSGTKIVVNAGASNEVAINEASADSDFRVESNSNTHMLFVDAGNDLVGINNDAPESVLEVMNTTAETVALGVYSTQATGDVGDETEQVVFLNTAAGCVDAILTINNTSTDSNGANMTFFKNSSDAQDDDNISVMRWKGKNENNGQDKVWAQLTVQQSDVASGDEGALMKYEVFAGGTDDTADLRNLFSIGGEDVSNATQCEVTVNDAGINCDFRVEGDSDTHLIFVDGSADKVGISATAPTTTLDVDGSFRTGLVTLTGNTSITAALHAGRTILLGEVGGNAALTATLPAATGTGNVYRFIVSVVNTSNYLIKVVGNDIMQGNILTNSTGDSPDLAQFWPTAADSDTITMDATTTGGASIGDYIELIDILADTWAVSGMTTSSGTEATPFSATVS